MRRLATVLLVVACIVWCISCKKSQAGNSTAASTPAATAIPPQWLFDAMSFSDSGHDAAVAKVLSIADHDRQIVEFGRSASGDQCTLLLFLVGELAYKTQDPKYLEVADDVQEAAARCTLHENPFGVQRSNARRSPGVALDDSLHAPATHDHTFGVDCPDYSTLCNRPMRLRWNSQK